MSFIYFLSLLKTMAFFTATTLAVLSAAAAISGTAVSVYGQRQAAAAAEATGKYNAELQRNQAKQEMAVAGENARRKTRENARILGMQRAALAQSGLAMAGTPLAVLGETAMTLHRDILDIGFDAANKSRSLNAGADMSIYTGRQQASAIRTNAAASTLSGLSSAAMGYGNAKGLFAPPATPKG